MLSLLISVSLLPFAALADSVDSSEHDRMVAMACDAFPEYTDQLQRKVVRSSRSGDAENSSISVLKTKRIDESTFITYQQNTDGTYFITTISSDGYTPSYSIVDSRTGTGYSYVKINIRVTSDGSPQVFAVNNVSFQHVQGGTCSIISTGDLDLSNIEVARHEPGSKLNGTTASPAYALYFAQFANYGNPMQADIRLTVTPSSFYITAKAI